MLGELGQEARDSTGGVARHEVRTLACRHHTANAAAVRPTAHWRHILKEGAWRLSFTPNHLLILVGKFRRGGFTTSSGCYS
jgi:hypothetical protein